MKPKYLILIPVFILVLYFALRDRYILPFFDHLRLGSTSYEREIRIQQGYYPQIKNQVVWNSKKLKLEPPKLSFQPESEKKVLAADPSTWVDINLSTQTLCLFYSGGTNCFLVSTGLPGTPTVTGTFSIWTKLASTLMRGPGYYLPGVPWTMYFYRGYGIHGTYWHNNFGHPMSHGCVNMRTPEAQFVYDRVSVGTRVVVHY